ncbi:MAG: carboxyl transferase [Lachnospiraceae bacterium]|nr:carboxyl transferase [Lachnospiraceae bacterium]
MSTTSKARQRIDALLDENSFVEIGSLVTARATDFDLKQAETPSDGVVTGYGVIDGNLVYVYSQDSSVLAGTVGEMHAKKITALYDMALKMGAPIIALIDSAGLRLQEATDALNAFGEIYQKQVMASGVIPQISAVFGNCGGGLAISQALSDFTFMEEKNAKLFVNAPNTLDGNEISKNDTSSAAFQSESGLVDVVADEATIFAQIRELVSFLPGNCDEEAVADCTDDLNRVCADLAQCAADPAISLSRIADDQNFFEVKANHSKRMVTGFIRLDGMTVGCVANRTVLFDEDGKEAKKFDAVLCPCAAQKAADFINFCDAFEIPVLSLTNVKGFAASVDAEKKMAKAVAKLVAAFANATVPKVNVIVGQAYGSAYVAMNSKALGADMTFAWNNAEVGALDAKHAAQIMYDGESADKQAEAAAEYAKLQTSALGAAKRGYVDTMIDAADTRKYVIGAFEMLYTKSEDRPAKKHSTI